MQAHVDTMSRYVCRHCIGKIMVVAWETKDRYLASTLSQAAIIKVAEPFYKLCLLQSECYSAALLCASQGCVWLLQLGNAEWVAWYDSSDYAKYVECVDMRSAGFIYCSVWYVKV